jgi:queuine tRNA-ribosyltransferase
LERRDRGYRGELFGIIQGNFDRDLRKRCRDEILSLDFPGVAIGGLSVGEPKSVFEDFLAFTAEELPETTPRYLMGIGTPDYILSAIESGIDMFDCVFPTRVARNGLLFTAKGPLTIKNTRFEWDFLPPDPECRCRVCANYSRSYLRHLFRSGEILYSMLASEHNLAFLASLVTRARYSIQEGRFMDFKKSFLADYTRDEE